MTQFNILQSILYRIAKEDSNVFFVGIDGLSGFILSKIKQDFPERVFFSGIGEQNSISISGGLALHGKTVFVVMYGGFAVTKTYDQLKLDIGYNNANVKILSLQSGLRFNAVGGYSHWGIEDITLLRCVPNIKVISSCSVKNFDKIINYAYSVEGPVYVRLDNLHSIFSYHDEKIEYNLLLHGKDAVIFTTGAATEYVYSLCKPLKYAGIKYDLINVNFIKPFDIKIVLPYIKKRIPIIVLEEQVAGGLSSIIAEIVAEKGCCNKFLPIYIKNEVYNLTGTYEYVSEKLLDYKNMPNQLIQFVNKWIKILKMPLVKVKANITTSFLVKTDYLLFGLFPVFRIEYQYHEKKCNRKSKFFLFKFFRIK